MIVLYRALREDRFLLFFTVLLAVAAAVPLFVTPFFPFADLHNNVGAASTLGETLWGHGLASTYYRVHIAPIPYWTTYLVLAGLKVLVGPLWAAKDVCWGIVVLLPLSVMRLLIALYRSPRLGLWAFALGWDHNLYSGWIAFLFGMSLAFFALALFVECSSWKQALGLLPLTVLIALTHVEAVAFFLVAGGLLALVAGRPFRAVGHYAIAGAGTLVMVLPWLYDRYKANIATSTLRTAITFGWHTPTQKLGALFAYTLSDLPSRYGEAAAAFAFVVMLLGPLFLAGLPRKDPTPTDRGRALVIFLAVFALYALAPIEVSGPIHHYYTYPRYATFILLALLLVPKPRLRGRQAAALIPGLVAALWMDNAVVRQFRDFGKTSRAFLDIIAAVQPNSSYITLVTDSTDPACNIAPYNEIHAYIVASKGGYDPYLFNTPDNPLLYRDRRPPVPRTVKEFTMDRVGRFYDYIVVQGLSGDPFTGTGSGALPPNVKLVRESGMWRLYSVKKR
jgi:hypothetical protein